MRINNHLTRALILRRPLPAATEPTRAFSTGDFGDVQILPGESAEVEFWDRIKNHPIYQNLLSRRLITLGQDAPEPGGSEAFTSNGDSLFPPDKLNPELDQAAAENDPLKPELAYGNKVKVSKQRGRRSKAPAAEQGKPAAEQGE
ncbi:MAG: hypothetical protein LBU64_05945 [Planctomycetota bacterium]|jgi:hypothetical protein|nr:hypothetical protein [Planctomycetota bacterium]